ncbi:Mars [Operophtera brumata]|uniref:Mars n=1 Tax=Operophtera brumata TaxID=104452 RepID=A0A0L7LGK0_OPEBR|nr:Mars [Operophtera brumata]
MDKSFDFTRLMKNHEKKHKGKPAQFVSVAGGVQKRLEINLKTRKSTRSTVFDSIRNLSRCASPLPLTDAQQKVENRRQQLVKWKEQKEKKKKEAAARKQKPFLSGVPHAPLKFVPPPPPMPSTSGRVTRSQTAQNSKQVKEKNTQSQSFAPKNALFKPPPLKNVPYVNLMALKPKKSKITVFDFNPILPQTIQEHKINGVKQTRPTKGKGTKPIPKTISGFQFQSSSSSEPDLSKCTALRTKKWVPQSSASSGNTDSSVQSPVRVTRKPEARQTRARKSIATADSPVFMSKSKSTPKKSFQSEPKPFTPKNPVPKSESSSEERLRSPTSPCEEPITLEQIIKEAKISPCVVTSRGKDNARREMKKKLQQGLMELDTSNIDNIDHFRRQLASEIKRITEMCETWDRILEHTVLPDSIQEGVLGAVGQARLLMSQKLQQFAKLVERCARPEPGVALVTPADLHGFWDMVFMQNSASFAMLRASVLGKNMVYEGVAPLPQTPVPHMNATPGRSILKQASVKSANKRSSKKPIKVVLFDEFDTGMNTEKKQPVEIQEEKVLETFEINVDSLLSMDGEKENYRRRSHRLARQDATEDYFNPVMTRSRWKNTATPQTAQEKVKTPQETKTQEKTRRSTRTSKVLEVLETNAMEDQTPKRAPRTWRSGLARNNGSIN